MFWREGGRADREIYRETERGRKLTTSGRAVGWAVNPASRTGRFSYAGQSLYTRKWRRKPSGAANSKSLPLAHWPPTRVELLAAVHRWSERLRVNLDDLHPVARVAGYPLTNKLRV